MGTEKSSKKKEAGQNLKKGRKQKEKKKNKQKIIKGKTLKEKNVKQKKTKAKDVKKRILRPRKVKTAENPPVADNVADKIWKHFLLAVQTNTNYNTIDSCEKQISTLLHRIYQANVRFNDTIVHGAEQVEFKVQKRRVLGEVNWNGVAERSVKARRRHTPEWMFNLGDVVDTDEKEDIFEIERRKSEEAAERNPEDTKENKPIPSLNNMNFEPRKRPPSLLDENFSYFPRTSINGQNKRVKRESGNWQRCPVSGVYKPLNAESSDTNDRPSDTLMEQEVLKLVRQSSFEGRLASDIARCLGIQKRIVNGILYAQEKKGNVSKSEDQPPRWTLSGNTPKSGYSYSQSSGRKFTTYHSQPLSSFKSSSASAPVSLLSNSNGFYEELGGGYHNQPSTSVVPSSSSAPASLFSISTNGFNQGPRGLQKYGTGPKPMPGRYRGTVQNNPRGFPFPPGTMSALSSQRTNERNSENYPPCSRNSDFPRRDIDVEQPGVRVHVKREFEDQTPQPLMEKTFHTEETLSERGFKPLENFSSGIEQEFHQRERADDAQWGSGEPSTHRTKPVPLMDIQPSQSFGPPPTPDELLGRADFGRSTGGQSVSYSLKPLRSTTGIPPLMRDENDFLRGNSGISGTRTDIPSLLSEERLHEPHFQDPAIASYQSSTEDPYDNPNPQYHPFSSSEPTSSNGVQPSRSSSSLLGDPPSLLGDPPSLLVDPSPHHIDQPSVGRDPPPLLKDQPTYLGGSMSGSLNSRHPPYSSRPPPSPMELLEQNYPQSTVHQQSGSRLKSLMDPIDHPPSFQSENFEEESLNEQTDPSLSYDTAMSDEFLEAKILSVLSSGKTMRTSHIATAVFGPRTPTSKINPTMYKLAREGYTILVQQQPPMWRIDPRQQLKIKPVTPGSKPKPLFPKDPIQSSSTPVSLSAPPPLFPPVLSPSFAPKVTPASLPSSEPQPLMSIDTVALMNKNPISTIMEFAQSNKKQAFIDLMGQSGPSHKPKFTFAVRIGDRTFPPVVTTSKKDGRREAAEAALRTLVGEGGFVSKASESMPGSRGTTFYDKIASLSHQTFNRLAADVIECFSGKKVIAALVMESADETRRVIALGTGNRCVTGNKLSLEGETVNDSHAEIITRRAFMRYLYRQLKLYKSKPDTSILITSSSNKLRVKPGVKFHLYISTAPCGDGAQFSWADDQEGVEGTPGPEVFDGSAKHKPTMEKNIQGLLRTKMELGEGTIPMEPNQPVQTYDGLLRGEQRLRTMSCSDKICRWNILGLQGALLSNFLEPVYLSSLTLGALYHHGHLSRAVCCRLNHVQESDKMEGKSLPPGYRINHPQLGHITSPDPARGTEKTKEFSVNWYTGCEKVEVTDGTLGRIKGVLPSRLSKANIISEFKEVCQIYSRDDLLEGETYQEAKEMAADFQQAKAYMKELFRKGKYGKWVDKPMEVEMFSIKEGQNS